MRLVSKIYQLGNIRERKMFLTTPLSFINRYHIKDWRWLENVKILEKLIQVEPDKWKPLKFVDG